MIFVEQKIFSALADPTRRAIFESLRTDSRTVGDLASNMTVSRPAVSQHMKALEDAGLVTVEPKGNRRFYSINRTGLVELRKYLDSFWSDALSAYATEISNRTKSTSTKDDDEG